MSGRSDVGMRSAMVATSSVRQATRPQRVASAVPAGSACAIGGAILGSIVGPRVAADQGRAFEAGSERRLRRLVKQLRQFRVPHKVRQSGKAPFSQIIVLN